MEAVSNGSELRKAKLRNKKNKRQGWKGTSILYAMMIPGVLLLFIYNYLPMLGLVIAFQDFDVTKGIRALWEPSWVGFKHFESIFGSEDFPKALANTLTIATMKTVTMFFVPVIMALLLNEIRKSMVKRTVQTLVYLPHFLSWVILAGIIKDILSTDGLANTFVVRVLGMESYYFLGDKNLFQPILILTNIWKEFGFSTIIFLAAITSIDPNLYEAAIVDGANRWKQTWHVTLPGMRPIIVLCLVLSLGGILNAGFDQVFNLLSVPVWDTGDIIDTLVYRKSIQGGQYDLGTAIGLFQSSVSFILISVSYWMAYKFANYEIF
jgi:putative aldouronate transport system permease protein